MNIGELFVSLGFDVDDQKLKDFNEGISNASKEVLKLSAVATGGVLALSAFLEGSVTRALGLRNFTTETGQAAEGLQRFQSVVNQVNASVSTEEAAHRYRALADAMTDLSQNGGGADLARLTGGAFHLGMKEEDVIEAIRNYKQRFIAENGGGQIGIAAHARLLDRIGVGAGSERAFDVSKDKYFAMSDQFVRSQQFIDKGSEIAGKISAMHQEWDSFKDDLLSDWAEPLMKAMRDTEAWLKDFNQSFKAIVNDWKNWPEWSHYLIEGLTGIAGVLVLVSSPLAATAAAAGALAFAIWDIGRAIRGLPSYTGDAWKGLKELYSTLHGGGSGADSVERPAREYLMRNGQAAAGTTNTILGQQTVHINNPNASAKEIVAEIQRVNQQNLNRTLLSVVGTPH